MNKRISDFWRNLAVVYIILIAFAMLFMLVMGELDTAKYLFGGLLGMLIPCGILIILSDIRNELIISNRSYYDELDKPDEDADETTEENK